MNCHYTRLLISFIFALSVRHCGSFSSAQMKKSSVQLVLPIVTCSSRGLKAVFDPLVKSNMLVKDTTTMAMLPVPESEESCGVRLSRGNQHSLSLYSRYSSCYALIEGSKVILTLQVQLTGEDRWFRLNVSCPLIKRHSGKTRLFQTPLPKNCDVESALRVDCGHQGISSHACDKLGCCYDAQDSTCFYRLDACSLDGHFVFSVKATDTDPPIDPSNLIVKDQPTCFPAVANQDTAVFKIGIADCDTKMRVEDDMVTYEVDLEELHTKSINNQFRLQIQCEYEEPDLNGGVQLRSLNPGTNPPPVVALGSIRVQMRIAEDASFTSFVPEDQLPLTLPLREAAYVEISIGQPSPDPTLSLRVRDCFAYPASRHSVWTLLYDGCPNPLDNMKSSVPVDNQGNADSHSQVRRFDVKTFAFLDPHTGHRSKEEMFFYCWVEICTNDVDCVQSCAITSLEEDRQKRQAESEPDQMQLVSLGPLLLGQNSTELEDNPCAKETKMFQVMVYVLSGTGAVLLIILMLILMFAVGSRIRKGKKPEAQQACEAQVDKEPSQ